jgi:CheY-like chemotaxis protein
MARGVRLLFVEDVASEAELAVRELGRAGLHCEWERVETEAGLVEALQGQRPDLIVSDFTLPQYSGLDALTLATREAPEIPFIFVSSTIGEERATEALKHGAVD